MQERLTFDSDGLKLSAIVHVPDDIRPGERRPAVMVLHGFGSKKESTNCIGPCEMLTGWGYVTIRFDFRGCGESEGEYGRLICLEQVSDTSNALSYLQSRADVDPDRIAALGSSFGAAVAVYTGGVDKRVAAVISSGGWGDGERKFRGQHIGAEAWTKFTDMLEANRAHKEKTGQSMMVKRWDIVPIPEHLRANLAANSHMDFPGDTAQSMFDFVADDVVGDIAPRPLLLLHSSVDSVTPTEQSIEMFKRAGQPTDLHLTADTDHFMFAEGNVRVVSLLKDWLDRYFPVKATVDA
jgi:uncharacterized protein